MSVGEKNSEKRLDGANGASSSMGGKNKGGKAVVES